MPFLRRPVARRLELFAEGCRQYQARYDDAFSSFNVQTPQAVDGEHPEKYRIRLFNRFVRKLPEGQAGGRPLGPAMDNIERMVLDAARQEGLQPSFDNLPPDGSIVMQTRSDANTGGKFNEFFGRESFIKKMGRPGRKVLRIVDPRSGNAIWGAPFSRAG